MHRTSKFAAVLGAIAVLAVVAQPAVAKTDKINIKGDFKQSGTKISGTFKGKPWGKVKATGTLIIPVATVTFKLKGGTVTVRGTGTLKGTTINSKWKVLKGTGKYKGAKGKGTATGQLDLTNYVYKGTIKY